MRLHTDGTTEISGSLKIDTASADSARMVYVDTYGKLKTFGPGNPIPGVSFYWDILGNANINEQVHYLGTNNVSDLVFKTTSSPFSLPAEHLRITKNGGVGIGTSTVPLGYKLVVEGNIGAREIIVVKPGDPWPDYVFSKGYSKLSLHALKTFIDKYHRLPGMPSAAEINEKGGIAIGEFQIKHLEKTEEAYLYIIELKNDVEYLKAQIVILMDKLNNK